MAENIKYAPYKKKKLLGEGSFGKAYLVQNVNNGSYSVLKQVNLSRMRDNEKRSAYKEAEILKNLDHQNVVEIQDVFKTQSGKLWIIMEFCEGGDVEKFVKKQRGKLMKESQILEWFTQICLAVKHIHDRKIIHRDLKLQNIFLTKDGQIKLGDFGIARVLNHTREIARTVVGTPYYLSPEIINHNPYRFATDIWSLGVILYELCALSPPFQAQNLNFLALKIVKGQYSPISSHYSKDMKSLIASLLQVNPNKRPSINRVLQHKLLQPFISKVMDRQDVHNEFNHTVLHGQIIDVQDRLLRKKFDGLKLIQHDNIAKPDQKMIEAEKKKQQQEKEDAVRKENERQAEKLKRAQEKEEQEKREKEREQRKREAEAKPQKKEVEEVAERKKEPKPDKVEKVEAPQVRPKIIPENGDQNQERKLVKEMPKEEVLKRRNSRQQDEPKLERRPSSRDGKKEKEREQERRPVSKDAARDQARRPSVKDAKPEEQKRPSSRDQRKELEKRRPSRDEKVPVSRNEKPELQAEKRPAAAIPKDVKENAKNVEPKIKPEPQNNPIEQRPKVEKQDNQIPESGKEELKQSSIERKKELIRQKRELYIKEQNEKKKIDQDQIRADYDKKREQKREKDIIDEKNLQDDEKQRDAVRQKERELHKRREAEKKRIRDEYKQKLEKEQKKSGEDVANLRKNAAEMVDKLAKLEDVDAKKALPTPREKQKVDVPPVKVDQRKIEANPADNKIPDSGRQARPRSGSRQRDGSQKRPSSRDQRQPTKDQKILDAKADKQKRELLQKEKKESEEDQQKRLNEKHLAEKRRREIEKLDQKCKRDASRKAMRDDIEKKRMELSKKKQADVEQSAHINSQKKLHARSGSKQNIKKADFTKEEKPTQLVIKESKENVLQKKPEHVLKPSIHDKNVPSFLEHEQHHQIKHVAFIEPPTTMDDIFNSESSNKQTKKDHANPHTPVLNENKLERKVLGVRHIANSEDQGHNDLSIISGLTNNRTPYITPDRSSDVSSKHLFEYTRSGNNTVTVRIEEQKTAYFHPNGKSADIGNIQSELEVMKQASRLVDQRMGIIDKENVDDNVFNNIINDTTEDDYVKPVITVIPDDAETGEEDDPTSHLLDYSKLEDMRIQLEKQIGPDFDHIYQKIREIMQRDDAEEYSENVVALVEKLKYDSSNLHRVNQISHLSKFVVRELMLEFSDKQSVSRRTISVL